MEVIFHFIFLVKTWFWRGCFRPEVGNVIRATEFQGNEMVDFILTWRMIRYSIFSIDLVFLAIRDIADSPRVSIGANLLWSCLCGDGTKCSVKRELRLVFHCVS